MNLVDADILTAPVFSCLPKFQSVVYRGMVGEKIRYFEAARDGGQVSVLTLMLIRAEEKFFWESCGELLEHAMTQAATMVEGVFSFDLLSFDVHRELKSFSGQELARLVANHGRRLAPGQGRLIKYSSCFGLLRKLSHEDWGKIILKTAVDIFAKDPTELAAFIQKTITATAKQPAPKFVVFHDLSQEPVFQPVNIEQQTRLQKIIGQQQTLFEAQPEIYILDRNGVFGQNKL